MLILTPYVLTQSMDPLPMQGPELGVQADDMDLGEPDREEKQEVLENKDVRFVLLLYISNAAFT